jgi:hypothetical protein
MKKIIFYALAVTLAGTACNNNNKNNVVSNPYQPVATEVPAILAYIEDNGLNMSMSPDSIWYDVSNYGIPSDTLTIDSATALVNFTCQTLDGTILYQSSSTTPDRIDYYSNSPQGAFAFAISYFLVTGNNNLPGFPLGKGATFDFIIPSRYQGQLFFGTTTGGITIPTYEPLYYHVQFVDKQPS